ncbi:MAG: LacI family DNA-binding transcriptional regulator [Acidobacteria bacterium]|nr:LacI family DNA-binding transcriptional regulator [Acidobacteriota bacterium]
MPITLADIAEALGVSKMTVSRAINNDPKIKAETRERVMEVVRKMNYRPNQNARALATNRSYLLGLVVPDLMHSYYAEIAKAIESVARPAGYEILLCTTDENAAKEVAEVAALRHRTDGLIIASAVASPNVRVYREMIQEGTRMVLLDRHFDRIACPSVITNNVRVGLLATEHLIALGHRRIGHLHGPDVRVADDRLEGYKQALMNHQIAYDEDLVRSCGFLEINGYQAMRRWIAEGNLPTAIFAGNDPAAIGAINALFEAGLNVPDEMAIVGAGCIHYGDLLRVPLTTVGWDIAKMGQQAARLLINAITMKSNKNSPNNAPKHFSPTIIPPQLIVRRSCGAIR